MRRRMFGPPGPFRQYTTAMANTPASATALIEVFNTALIGVGKPEVNSSSFFDLESLTVKAY